MTHVPAHETPREFFKMHHRATNAGPAITELKKLKGILPSETVSSPVIEDFAEEDAEELDLGPAFRGKTKVKTKKKGQAANKPAYGHKRSRTGGSGRSISYKIDETPFQAFHGRLPATDLEADLFAHDVFEDQKEILIVRVQLLLP